MKGEVYMTDNKEVSILDVTIRDGSYAIDYQYRPEQVAGIAAALDAAGIDYIEVSHGCGLGAGRFPGLAAAATDLDYVRAAKTAVKSAGIGVIATPPIVTRPEDVEAIIDEVDFIRFAANANTPETAEASIAAVKQRRSKLPVFFQMMRSTRLRPEAMVTAAKRVEEMGADLLYIVDTAGHFLPEEVADLVAQITDAVDIGVGFHGHNNLGMAIANTVAAVEAGATSIDASLRGMGRAAGNAQLEAVVSLLQRRGFAQQVDLDRLVRAGEELVAPVMPPAQGIASMDLLLADANIDLYPLAPIQRIAEIAGVDFMAFVRTLAQDEELVETTPECILRALTAMGADATAVLKQVGWIT